ncbi:MAG: hypothetical protein IT176_00650 [Acidobacteria bacterium]|nr:hypothetical protein [Acidobacteriota bacterium]
MEHIGIEPMRRRTHGRVHREKLAEIDLHRHDLRHEAACRRLAKRRSRTKPAAPVLIRPPRRRALYAIRELIKTIRLEPDGERLEITLVGEPAGMLSAARDNKRPSETDDLLEQIQLVAGARPGLHRRLCWTAA